jgi:hypothetical protein
LEGRRLVVDRGGSTSSVEIVGGWPVGEVLEAAERGEVVLGGCVGGIRAPAL